ncbi:ThuA domain-containing protein [Croceiramulus getboli]|nr:ThuA domain-containing protein [Flavobacteriaceae bacterium YJPT1-3]
MNKILCLLGGVFLSLCSCQGNAKSDREVTEIEKEKQTQVLVFSKTNGYRHASIERGTALIKELGTANNFRVSATEDSLEINTKRLAETDLIVFLNTTLDVLGPDQEQALEKYIRQGGAFFGIHSAADTEYDWPFYGQLVGAYFDGHPNNPNMRTARVFKSEQDHPTTAHFADTVVRKDEWYNYKSWNAEIIPLLYLDESSYEGGTNGDDHPIAWFHESLGGRSYYMGAGHDAAAFDEPDFQEHMLRAIQWTLGREVSGY